MFSLILCAVNLRFAFTIMSSTSFSHITYSAIIVFDVASIMLLVFEAYKHKHLFRHRAYLSMLIIDYNEDINIQRSIEKFAES